MLSSLHEIRGVKYSHILLFALLQVNKFLVEVRDTVVFFLFNVLCNHLHLFNPMYTYVLNPGLSALQKYGRKV